MIVGWEPAAGYVPAGHKARLGACRQNEGAGWAAGAVGFTCGLDPWQAATLDTKLDDGLPFSGRAVVTTQGYIYRGPTASTISGLAAYCDDGGTGGTDASRVATARYRTERTLASWGGSPVGRYCALSISAGF